MKNWLCPLTNNEKLAMTTKIFVRKENKIYLYKNDIYLNDVTYCFNKLHLKEQGK